MKKRIFLAFLLSLSLLFSSCGSVTPSPVTSGGDLTSPSDTSVIISTDDMDLTFSGRDENDDYSESDATMITLSENNAVISGKGADFSENVVTISGEGTYILTGTTTTVSLKIEADKTAKLQLVFDGVSITAENGPALYIKTADKVFLTLADGSENFLADGMSYEMIDEDTTLDAALFSKEDLTINGGGKLTVNGNMKHGIVSKDDLVITGGVIDVTAVNVGLGGKDCVKIGDADITIHAGTDGIRSDNTEDAARGFVHVNGGNVTITAGNDGIQAETLLSVEKGTIHITSGGGSANASTTSGGGWNDMWGGWGGFGGRGESASTQNSDESAKGLKSTSAILITGGKITIDSSDDAIHANGDVQISDGTLRLSSGDDGIHADSTLKISGGDITITKSYEGIESAEIVIAGGKISLTASDDGLNAAGGNDSSSLGGRPGMGMFESTTGSIEISGGYLFIDAAGDGVDSNGSLTVTGGVTLVCGPTNSGNGPLDYGSGAKVTGGVFIAVGTAGMAVGFTEAENQGAIFISTGTNTAETSLSLLDENGNVAVSFTPTKAYQCAVITAPTIVKGECYTLVMGATVENTDENGYAMNTTASGGIKLSEIEMTSLLYGSSGGMGGFPGGFGGGGMGGGGMGGRPR